MHRDEINRWKEELRKSRQPIVIPEGEAVVLLIVGDTAEIISARHPATLPLQVPAARIAEQAGIPAKETPGRRFAVATLTETDADGFALLNDPRL